MTRGHSQKSTNEITKVGDPNAKAILGRCRNQVFKDKTKYTRKIKHKKQGEE